MKRARDPWTKDPFDPLELLARLGGRCAQRLPTGGGRGQPLTDADIDAALGMMPNTFAADLAMAVATRDHTCVAALTQAAFESAIQCLRASRVLGLDMDAGQNRHRVRMVLADAVLWLIYPEARVPEKVAARRVKMRHGTYVEMLRYVDALLHGSLDDARLGLRETLYGSVEPPFVRHLTRERSAP